MNVGRTFVLRLEITMDPRSPKPSDQRSREIPVFEY